VEMAGTTEETLRDILEQQGKFEAKIRRHVKIDDNEGSFSFGQGYDITVEDESINIDGSVLDINETIILEAIEFQFTNITDKEIELSASVFDGSQVSKVFSEAQRAGEISTGNGYNFQFSIIIEREAAEQFAIITKDIPVEIGGNYLTEQIDFYLDDKSVDSLNIGSGLKGAAETSIQISGPGETEEDAYKNMKNLQAILRSGALPTELEIIKVDTISPTLGEAFAKTALRAIVVAILAVSILIFIRYRDPRIALPIMITSLAEVITILGFASLINWTIDLASIAGIIAAVGTGVDDQIIITDESSSKKKELTSLKAKLKNAFFIIFTAYFTTLAAMFPLLFIAAGGVMGFAITTIIGVTIGVLITRPAYGRIIEHLHEGN